MQPAPYLPVLALLIGASTWGIVWYPYRLLAHNGVGGEWSALITYAIASAAGLALFPRSPREWPRQPWMFLLMGLSAGISNVAYIISILEGNVMRVVLLFYLAPLWTIPMAHFILKEKLGARGVRELDGVAERVVFPLPKGLQGPAATSD